MWQLLKDLASGAAAFLRFREKRQELTNTPEMQANAKAKTDAEIRNTSTAAVAKNDLDEIRKLAAE